MQSPPSIPMTEIPDAALVVGRDGSIVSANAHAERMFGYARNELAGLALELLVPERYRERHGRLVEEFMADPEPRPMGMGRELHALKRDGQEFPVEIAIGPTADDSLAVAVIRDITPTVNAREKLRERQGLAELLSTVSHMFLRLSPEEIERAFPEAAELITETLDIDRSVLVKYVDAENMMRIAAISAMPGIAPLPENSESRVPWIQARLRKGNIVRFSSLAELPEEAAADRSWLEGLGIPSFVGVPIRVAEAWVGAMVFETQGRSRVWSEEDVEFFTIIAEIYGNALARKRAQVELKERMERATGLESARKRAEEGTARADRANQAKSAFLANMSHEIRTPLNAILGASQLMNRDPELRDRHGENLEMIARSGQYLLSLIDDVLDLSRVEAGHVTLVKTAFNITKMLDDIKEMVGLHADKKGLTLTLQVDAGVPEHIETDEGKLRQILINLLGNGIKYTNAGSVALRVERKEDGRFGPRVLSFAVEDTGIGIASEDLDKIFEPFAQIPDARTFRPGIGLGLAVSRQYAGLMGGSVLVQSQPGQGSTFTLEFPYESVDLCEIREPERTGRVIGLAPDQPDYRILIVEDDPESRSVLRQLLEQVGFRVEEAVDGQQAVEMHGGLKPDLIWMDIRLPVLDGLEATKRIRITEGDAAHTPIIALSASTFEEDTEKVRAAGCDDFLRKPFQEEDIFGKMAQHLGIRYLYDEGALHAEDGRGVKVDAAHLKALPQDWVVRFRQAAAKGKVDDLLELLERARPDHSRVSGALARMVRDYEFSKILALLEAGDRHE